MKGSVSVGYLRPDPSTVRFEHPQIYLGGEQVESDIVKNWDYHCNLSITQRFEVSLEQLKRSCGLPVGAQIGAALCWSSTRTGLRGSSECVILENGPVLLQMDLPGAELGGRLRLESRIFLLSVGGTPESIVAPSRVGAILWSTESLFYLEGKGSRFPTVAIDFDVEGVLGGPNALWYLSINAIDPATANGAGSMCLYLNRKHLRVAKYLANPDAADSIALAKLIDWDILRQIATRAVLLNEIDLDTEHDEETLAYLMRGVLKHLFPGRSVAELQELYASDPSQFEAHIQGEIGLLA